MMKFKKILVGFLVCCAIITDVVAQTESATGAKHRWVVYGGIGPNYYFNNLEKAKDKVTELNYSFVTRLMWEPEYFLSIGFETGYNRLYSISGREVIYYTKVAAPVLTTDRDFVIRLTIDPDPKTKGMIVEAVSIPDYLPVVENVIRVPYSRARWNVVPLGVGKLSIDYSIDIDLGGSVPPWIVNMVAPKAPYETFHSLREKIGDYRDQRVPFISNQ